MNTSVSAQLNIEMFHERISLRHDGDKQHEQNESDEHALATFQKQYKGRCSKCGKYGHKPSDSGCVESQSQGQDRKFSTC